MKTFEVMGLDDGFDFVKLVAGSRSKEQLSYPSVYRRIPDNADISVNYLNENKSFPLEDMRLEFNKVRYFIGQNVFDEDVSGLRGTKLSNDDRYLQDAEKAKILAGILKMAEKNGSLEDVEVDLLVHGLNISSKEEHTAEKEKEYSGNFTVKVNGEKFKIKIHESKCITEGLAALWAEILDYDGEPNSVPEDRYTGIIDIGGKSVDYFISRKQKHMQESINSINYGITEAFKRAHEESGIPRNRLEYDFIADRKKIDYRGKEVNLKKLIEPHFEALAEDIANQVKRDWDESVYNLHKIKLCGGASNHLIKYIDKSFSDYEVELFDEPIMGNAIGFYKIGMAMRRED